ncbi:MAG: SulP family inorganic anion transporter [Vicinamibacterales bacterium]
MPRPRPLPDWLPRSLQVLRQGYSLSTFAADAVAGVTVGLVALPLAMAFAIASGLTPQAGIYCAVVTGFLISALGGSRVQIGGPTGAFVVVVAGIIATYGVDGLFMCTMMAGVILVVMGLSGTGSAVKYIPRPVIVGFTNGIALVIASTQLRDFLGIPAEMPGEFLARLHGLWLAAGTISPAAVGLGGATLITIIGWNRFIGRLPGYVVALVGGTVAAAALGLPVETIGTRFGGIPSGLPSLQVPVFRPELLLTLLSPALTVALLGAIESLLSAVVADRMSGDTHNPNTELVAQGVANLVSPLFGGLPATGAIARTATNVRSGGRTPVAGMVHALTLVAILLVGAPLAAYVPLTVLAAILFVVAWNMGEWGEVPELLRLTFTDIGVWFTTFALTVLADLTVAVEVGMVMAALLFIRRVSETTTVTRVTGEYVESSRPHVLQDKPIPEYVAVFRIHGPFLFGSTDKIRPVVADMASLPPIVILRLRNMTAIDATGLSAIEDVAEALRDSGRTLIVCGALPQPAVMMRRAEFHRHLGGANICPNIEAALARARDVHEGVAARPLREAVAVNEAGGY